MAWFTYARRARRKRAHREHLTPRERAALERDAAKKTALPPDDPVGRESSASAELERYFAPEPPGLREPVVEPDPARRAPGPTAKALAEFSSPEARRQRLENAHRWEAEGAVERARRNRAAFDDAASRTPAPHWHDHLVPPPDVSGGQRMRVAGQEYYREATQRLAGTGLEPR